MSRLLQCMLAVVWLCCSIINVHAGRHYRPSRSFESLMRSSTGSSHSDEHHQIHSPIATGGSSSNYPSFNQGPYSMINNVDDRRDVHGAFMDIHDGKIIQVFDAKANQSMFYYFGASYSNCTEPPGMTGCVGDCGFYLNHNVSLFTSTDLINWSPSINQPVMQVARDFPVQGVIMFCPKVLFNPRTNTWVMWFNYDLGGVGYLGVMTSDTPHGKWTTVSTQVKMSTVNEGDFNLFQDDNLDAYILYTGRGPPPVSAPMVMVEKLSFDYTTSLGSAYNSGDLHHGVYCEAPAMTKREDTYLVSFGPDCCYCKGGSANTMFASKDPLGPYTSIGTFTSAIPAQQTDMLAFRDHRNETQILWLGDRWQSSPSGEKARDLTYMAILHFDERGHVEQLAFEDTVEIHVLTNAPAIQPLPGANSGAQPSSSFAPPSDYFGSTSSSSLRSTGLAVCNVDTAGSPLVNVTYEFNPPVTFDQVWSFPAKAGGIATLGSPFSPSSPSSLPFGAQSQYAFMNSNTKSSMKTRLVGMQRSAMYSISFWFALGACSKPKSPNSTVQISLYQDDTNQLLWQSPSNLPYDGTWTYVVATPIEFNHDLSVSFSMIVEDDTLEAVLINSVTASLVGPDADGLIIPEFDYSFEFPVLAPVGWNAWLYNPPINEYQPFNFTAGRGGIASVSSTWDPAPPIQPDCRQYAFIQNANNTYSVMTATLNKLSPTRTYHVRFFYSVRSSSQDLGDMSSTGITESQMSIFVDNERIYLSQQNLTASGGWMPAKTNSFTPTKDSMRLAFSVVNLDLTADSSILIDQVRVVEV